MSGQARPCDGKVARRESTEETGAAKGTQKNGAPETGTEESGAEEMHRIMVQRTMALARPLQRKGTEENGGNGAAQTGKAA